MSCRREGYFWNRDQGRINLSILVEKTMFLGYLEIPIRCEYQVGVVLKFYLNLSEPVLVSESVKY